MHKDVIHGVAKTIIDGIKDAQMQYDYAEAARKAGEHELAKMHLNEAQKRMNGVKEWYDYVSAKMGKHHEDDAAYAVMEDHYRDWAHKIKDRIASFKM
jgi:hypothetical protein